VFNSPMLHVLRVEMVINSPWLQSKNWIVQKQTVFELASPATPPPHPAYRTTARISIPAPVLMPAWTNSEVDMDEIYTRFDDEQTEGQLLAGRLNILFRDRRAHAHTRLLMEAEARMSRDAWTRAIDACDLVHGKVISLRTTVLGQIPEIRELPTADRRRQTVISELLRSDIRDQRVAGC
nr:hypothetical protein [Tanacetum cinerariifolium]